MPSRTKGTDLTADLGRLGNRGVLPKGERPPTLTYRHERHMAVDLPGLFMWTLIASFLFLQFAFLIWLS